MSATLLQKALLPKDFTQAHVKNIISAAKSARDADTTTATSTQDLLSVAFNDIDVAKHYLSRYSKVTLEEAETALTQMASANEDVVKVLTHGTVENDFLAPLRKLFEGGQTFNVGLDIEDAVNVLIETGRRVQGSTIATTLKDEATATAFKLQLSKTFMFQLAKQHADKLGMTEGSAEYTRLMAAPVTMADFDGEQHKKITAAKIEKKESGTPGIIRATLKPRPPTIIAASAFKAEREDKQSATAESGGKRAAAWLPQPGNPKQPKRRRFEGQQQQSLSQQTMPPPSSEQQTRTKGGWDPVSRTYNLPCKYCKEPRPTHKHADCKLNPHKPEKGQ